MPVTPTFPNTLIVIAGPTTAGKTALAVRLAKHLSCEILSADSRQFYKEMKIGTAPPSPDELREVKHHFVHHCSITDSMDVSRYEKEALGCLNSIWKKNRHVVLVGGSGLYIQAVCKGFDDLPDADPETRKKIQKTFEENGITELRLMLKKLDPDYYRQVDLANPKRLMRALEVCLTTGIPFSSFRKEQCAPRMFSIFKTGINPDRRLLHERINRRVDLMMKEGLEEEARSLLPYRHLNALNTVGYKELFEYFDGKCSLDSAVEKIKTNTRRFARRQMTWFRKDKEIQWLQGETGENCFSECISLLRQYGCDIPSVPA